MKKSEKMKSLIASICILGLVGMVVGVAVQAVDAPISATVTPKLIAVSVEDAAVAYGVLDYSASAANPTTQDTVTLVDTQAIKNEGNVNEDFVVKSSNAIKSGSGTADWDLVLAADIAKDKYCHQYSIDSGANWVDLPQDNSYTLDIITDIIPGNTDDLDLQILMPTDSTDVDDTKTITVTVLATES